MQVAAERGRAMSGSGGRTWPRNVGQAVAAAPCRVSLMGHGCTKQSIFQYILEKVKRQQSIVKKNFWSAGPYRSGMQWLATARGRVMSRSGGRTRPRHVGRWRPNAAAPCRAVAAERGRSMPDSGGHARPHHVGFP